MEMRWGEGGSRWSPPERLCTAPDPTRNRILMVACGPELRDMFVLMEMRTPISENSQG